MPAWIDSCSGQVAVISPRQVISGLVGKRVKVISVAKHHTIIATDGGEVFTWGSNRGQLFFFVLQFTSCNVILSWFITF